MTEGRESFTEWGVRWTYEGRTALEPRDSEEDARGFIDICGLDADAVVVCRTVTRTPWREVGATGAHTWDDRNPFGCGGCDRSRRGFCSNCPDREGGAPDA